MRIENRDDYIKYRFHRSEDSFDDALILAEKGKWKNEKKNKLGNR